MLKKNIAEILSDDDAANTLRSDSTILFELLRHSSAETTIAKA